jgi:hypothetical protein
MLFIDQVGAAFLLVTLTLCLQSAGIAALLASVRQATEGYVHELGPFRVAALFVRVMTAIIALHTLELLLWASCYRLALLAVMGVCLVLFRKQLCDGWLRRCVSTENVANAWAAREHRRGFDVWIICKCPVCDRYAARRRER